MKAKQTIMALCACILALSGCMEKDVYQEPREEEKEYNEFDYSTTSSNISLEVSYLNCGVEAAVYFELYDEIPVTKGEYNYIKRDDVTPLFAAYTGPKGVYSGTAELPAYLKKVYIYTPAFFAQTLIEAEVANGSIVAKDDEMAEEATTRVWWGEGDSYMVTTNRKIPDEYKGTRWKTWLGDYDDDRNGEIEYKYKGNDLKVSSDANLYYVHSQVINIYNTCPAEYRSYRDMYLSEDAEVAVTFLGGNTCWNSSLGYYYYKEGEKPASLNNANVIMLFPNTQDGHWRHNGVNAAWKKAGIDRGTIVQLKFYPNIANGNQAEATNTFPKGYRIGLVLANNAWSNRIKTDNKRYRAATSEGLSIDNSGNAMNEPRTAAYRYGDYVMISFEDHTNDQNFSDVVVTMTSNPVDAITDLPDVGPDDDYTTTDILKGTYAFEDMWPSTGDYDLNDVMVRYNYEKTFDKDNKIHSEAFIFKTFQNYASLTNGLAFKVLNNSGVTPASAKCEVRKSGEDAFTETTELAYEPADNVYRLTGNIKPDLGAEYKVTLTYSSPITTESGAQPFIYRNTADGGKRWEMHIAGEKPTSLMDESYYYKDDDASDPAKGIYFVRAGIYPFGFFLSGANEKDLAKMLDSSNESAKISDLYEGYDGWVESKGTENKDWYKQ